MTIINNKPILTGERAFSVDWLSVTFWEPTRDQVARWAYGVIGEPVVSLGEHGEGVGETLEQWESKGGNRFFSDVRGGAGGCRLSSGARAGGAGYLCLDMPGEFCQCVGGERWRDWFGSSKMLAGDWRVSRVDLAIDHVFFSPWELEGAFDAELVTCGGAFRSLRGEKAGYGLKTVYLGAQGGAKMLRVYQRVQPGGEGLFTRCELQLRQSAAGAAWQALMRLPSGEWGKYALGLMAGFVDVRADWWVDFVGAAPLEKLPVHRVDTSVEKIVEWFGRSCLSAAAVCYLQMGEGAFIDWVQTGARKIKPEIMRELRG